MFSDPTAREAYAAANSPAPVPPFIPSAVIEDSPPVIPGAKTPGFVTVWTDWTASDGSSIDRPRTSGISLPKALAARAAAAINAGKAYGTATLKRDFHGKTYVSAVCNLSGRYIHKCLEALGF